MSILQINEDWRGTNSVQEIGAVRSSTRHLVVITDTWTEPSILKNDSRLPRDGLPHPTELDQWCTNVRVEPRDNTRTVFDVTVEYSNDVDDEELEISKRGGTGAPPPNPLDDPPVIDGGGQNRPVPLWACVATGSPVRNAAADVLDPPPMGLAVESVVRVVRNEADFSYASHVKPWLRKVNSQEFSGAPPGDVLCTAVTYRRMYERGFRYWEISREFAFRDWNSNLVPNADYIDANFAERTSDYVTGWSVVTPHVGFYDVYADASVATDDPETQISYSKRRILDRNGSPIETPQFLNADGSLRKRDANGVIKPIMLVIQPYDSADFNALNLGI